MATGATLLTKRAQPSRPERDFGHLLDRLSRHHYPASLQVTAYYWLRTVCGSGYERRAWRILEKLIEKLRDSTPEWGSLADDLRNWVRTASSADRDGPKAEGASKETNRSNLQSEVLAPYIARLLNEWLPLEVSRLLIEEDHFGPEDGGIPAFAKARAMERLLVRERLSAGTLQALLQTGFLSPRFVYPADVEVLRDVVLFLLGRTEAPTARVLPAALLCVAPDTPLDSDYGDTASHAVLANRVGYEEVHVAISPDQANRLLRGDWLRIGSVLVTMDGRWWLADRLLEDGQRDLIAYRAAGRLEIDYSADHAHLRIPWPEAQTTWAGPVGLAQSIEIFGREWKISRWERDAEQTWVDLVFVRTMPVSKIAPVAELGLRRSRPVSVDIAWAALENALAAAAAQKSLEPVERLRHSELVPAGRALFALMEAVTNHRFRKREAIETRLRSISYQQAEVVPSYGRVPWRILPSPVRTRLLSTRMDTGLANLLADVFEGFPSASGHLAPTSPPHAA
jgi:hypothetical protein